MPQARITVNAVVGSNTSLPINTSVQLDNVNTGGEVSYNWSILDQPPGTADSLSNATIQNPTFTPKKEGTYLIQLVVNQGSGTEVSNKVVCAVRQLKTLLRIPAAGETIEADIADGWATDTNAYLRAMDALISDPGVVVGANTSGGTLTRGAVVRVTSSQVIKSGLPGQETVPGFTTALATSLGNVNELLCVLEGTVAGASSVPNGALCRARYLGKITSLALGGSPVVGDTVYVSNTGVLSLTAGTIERQMGSIMSVSGSNFDVWVDGVGGATITPINAPYVIYGAPGTLTNAKRLDGANATQVTGNTPYNFWAGDTTTVPLVARTFSSGSADIQQWQDNSGTVLSRVNHDGTFASTATSGNAAFTGTANVNNPGVSGVANGSRPGVLATSVTGAGSRGLNARSADGSSVAATFATSNVLDGDVVTRITSNFPGVAVYARTDNSGLPAVIGENLNGSGGGSGLQGGSASGPGVSGFGIRGMFGQGTTGVGVLGMGNNQNPTSTITAAGAAGVAGGSNSKAGTYGIGLATAIPGVLGLGGGGNGEGVRGEGPTSSDIGVGAYGGALSGANQDTARASAAGAGLVAATSTTNPAGNAAIHARNLGSGPAIRIDASGATSMVMPLNPTGGVNSTDGGMRLNTGGRLTITNNGAANSSLTTAMSRGSMLRQAASYREISNSNVEVDIGIAFDIGSGQLVVGATSGSGAVIKTEYMFAVSIASAATLTIRLRDGNVSGTLRHTVVTSSLGAGTYLFLWEEWTSGAGAAPGTSVDIEGVANIRQLAGAAATFTWTNQTYERTAVNLGYGQTNMGFTVQFSVANAGNSVGIIKSNSYVVQ